MRSSYYLQCFRIILTSFGATLFHVSLFFAVTLRVAGACPCAVSRHGAQLMQAIFCCFTNVFIKFWISHVGWNKVVKKSNRLFSFIFYIQVATHVPNLHAIIFHCEIKEFMFSHYYFGDFGAHVDLRVHLKHLFLNKLSCLLQHFRDVC